jgi:hypothetical protein
MSQVRTRSWTAVRDKARVHDLETAQRFLPAPKEAGRAIRAELIGSNACSALGITARGHAPLLALCQLLIEAGHDPNRPLLAYRGDTLCLRVRSIVEGAALAVEDNRHGTPRFRRGHARGDGAAPYVAHSPTICVCGRSHDHAARQPALPTQQRDLA